MKNWLQPGNTLTLIAPYDVTSGAGLQVGSIFGVASFDATEGAEVEAAVVGVFALARETGAPWSQGDPVYWDNVARRATHESEDNVLIGVATAPAGNDDETGAVRLNGAFGATAEPATEPATD